MPAVEDPSVIAVPDTTLLVTAPPAATRWACTTSPVPLTGLLPHSFEVLVKQSHTFAPGVPVPPQPAIVETLTTPVVPEVIALVSVPLEPLICACVQTYEASH